MREIKFRAWDKIVGKMIHPGETLEDGELVVIGFDGVLQFSGEDTYRPSDFILEQFTGLCDKNGKEIYEGDILFGIEEGDGETTAWSDEYFCVIFDEKLSGFIAHEPKTKNQLWDEQLCELNNEYEVIGNIHENPELAGK